MAHTILYYYGYMVYGYFLFISLHSYLPSVLTLHIFFPILSCLCWMFLVFCSLFYWYNLNNSFLVFCFLLIFHLSILCFCFIYFLHFLKSLLSLSFPFSPTACFISIIILQLSNHPLFIFVLFFLNTFSVLHLLSLYVIPLLPLNIFIFPLLLTDFLTILYPCLPFALLFSSPLHSITLLLVFFLFSITPSALCLTLLTSVNFISNHISVYLFFFSYHSNFILNSHLLLAYPDVYKRQLILSILC